MLFALIFQWGVVAPAQDGPTALFDVHFAFPPPSSSSSSLVFLSFPFHIPLASLASTSTLPLFPPGKYLVHTERITDSPQDPLTRVSLSPNPDNSSSLDHPVNLLSLFNHHSLRPSQFPQDNCPSGQPARISSQDYPDFSH
jgi:hypothetical protein